MARTLACVFAHPDDETFAVGGTIAHYASQGVRCHVFCATNGDAGKSSGVSVSSREELGARRLMELRAAGDVLGLGEIVAPGHADGALGLVDADVLVGQIVEFLRRHRPEIVISFGPEGAPTGHRDHRAISRAATAAFHLAGLETEYVEQLGGALRPHAPARLYYYAWHGLEEPDGKPPRASVPPSARIAVESFLPTKQTAFNAHVTQHVHRRAFEKLAMHDTECFALAGGASQPRSLVEDLFEGL